MWTAQWKHECEDGTFAYRTTHTEGHPITDRSARPYRCDCGKEFTLTEWYGPVEDVYRKRKPRRRSGGFNAQQMELFN